MPNQSLDGCFINCSNNGNCVYNNKNSKFGCNCTENYKGDECYEVRANRQCFTLPFPCKNNGTCITTKTGYKCNCTTHYYGKNCENKKKLCKGFSCSGNGYCIDKNDIPTCVCFKGYLGAKCNIFTKKTKNIKKTSNISTVIALILLIGSAFGIILLDCLTFWKEQKLLIFKKK